MRRRVGIRTYVAVISLGSVAVTLGVGAVSPSLPELQRVLNLGNAEIGWFTTAYVLPGVLLTVPLGILADAIGKRLLFCLALGAYGAAALSQATTTSYPLLLTLRVIQGACFAAAMPLTITLIGEVLSGHQRIRALSGRNAMLTGSEVVLPLAGALLAAISWRAPLILQGVTIPLAVYSFTILEKHESSSGGKRKYAKELLLVLRNQLGMFAVLLSGFSRFLFKFVMYGWLPILLVTERDASLTQAGVVISFTSLIAAVTSTRVPALVRSVPPSVMTVGSVLGLAISTGAFSLVGDWKIALVVGAVYGVGDGILAVLLDTYAIHTAKRHVRAGMVSINQTARNLGKLSSPLAMTALVAVSSLEVAFLVMALVGVAIVPAMIPLRQMDREIQHPEFGSEAEAEQAFTSGETAPYE